MATAVGIGQLVHGTDYPGRRPSRRPRRAGLRRGLRPARQDQRAPIAPSATPGCRRRAGPRRERAARARWSRWAARERLAPLATPRPGRAHLRAAPPRRRRRDLPRLLDARPRHRLPRPRPQRRRDRRPRGRDHRGAARAHRARSSARSATGDTVTIAREAIHRVRHAGTGPATTLHAYSPPLQRVGTYEVADDGALLRHPRPAETPTGSSRMTTLTDDLLDNNAAYVSGFDKGDLPLPPARKLAVLACMDARLDPAKVLGLERGRRPRDPQRGRRRLGRRAQIPRDLPEPARHRGDRPDPPHRLRHAHLHRRRVRRQARGRDRRAARLARSTPSTTSSRTSGTRSTKIRSSPFVPRTDNVRGFVYEVETGRLREVS